MPNRNLMGRGNSISTATKEPDDMLRSQSGFDGIDTPRILEVVLDNKIEIQNQTGSLLSLTYIRTSQQRKRNSYDRSKYVGRDFEFRKTPSRFCKANRFVLLTIESNIITHALSKPLGCNSWTCPECHKKKGYSVRQQLIQVAIDNNLSYMLTLTLDPQLIPFEYIQDTHKYITKLFNNLITDLKRTRESYFDKIKRKWNDFDLKTEQLRYIWVCEFQENGNAHLHVLLNQFLPVEIIRRIWVRIGGGHIMKIEESRSVTAAAVYLTKYVTKALLNAKKRGFKYFQRRYSISRSCMRKRFRTEPFFKRKLEEPRTTAHLMKVHGLDPLTPYLINGSKDTFNISFKQSG